MIKEVDQYQRTRINKEIIEKASSLKIDIPAITEELLKNDKYNENYTKENVLQAYQEMFHKCKILLKKYEISPWSQFEIGKIDNGKDDEGIVEDSIYFNSQGHFFSEYEDMSARHYQLEEIICVLHPIQQILTNLYLTLIRHAEFNKEKIKQLELEYV
ncbi:MAG TPA: hypothetical protein VLA74_06985 [Nitrososphaeraceae archaeon]|nr:hypothetical protein [Nitrososphaeraceae archaeon]